VQLINYPSSLLFEFNFFKDFYPHILQVRPENWEEAGSSVAITAMKASGRGDASPAPLLTAVDATSQVHLVIGSDSLAAARCTRCLEVGAKPIIIAPDTGDMHFSLAQRIQAGAVEWLRREFQDSDLTTLGRDEVDRVVDTVFITLGSNNPLSKFYIFSCHALNPLNKS
jgi:uroporphyrin-III C-methyltransferase